MTDTTEQTIAERVRLLRLASGLSMQKLADQAGLSKTTLANLEYRATIPATSTLIKIADVLETSVDWLLGRHDRAPDWYRKLPK